MKTIKPEMFRDAPIKFVLLVLGMVYGVFAVATGSGAGPTLLLICGGILFLWWLRTKTTELTLDQNDVLYSFGILSKTRVKLDRTKIRSIEVRQTLMHRLTDVGSLAVYTAGDAPEVVLRGMRQPNILRDQLA